MLWPFPLASVVAVEHDPTAHRSVTTNLRRRAVSRSAFAVLAVVALGGLSACGGDDDDAAATTTAAPVDVAPATTSTLAPATTTTPPTTTLPPLVLVTEGASLVVANASGIDGAAGRMTEALAAVGFSTGDAANSTEGQLNTTKVYYDADDPAAEAVASSVRDALGGGDIELLPLTTPAPLEDPEIGDATIVVAMGNDTADKSLDELQGRTVADDAEASDEDSDTEDDAGDDTDTTDAESTEGDDG